MMGAMFAAMALSGVALWAWSTGWFWLFMLIEAAGALAVYLIMHRSLEQARWTALE